MKYSILIPIYNEYSKLSSLKNELAYLKNNDFQIIIIDDGSDDGSYQILKTFKNIELIRIDRNRGKGFAVKEGLNHVLNKNVILMDGDLEVKIKDLFRLIKSYKGYNACVGIRWNNILNKPIRLNKMGNYITNTLFNILYKTKYIDILCCYKIISTKNLKSFKLKSNGFDLETEIMAKLSLSNIHVKEILITYNRRPANDGKKIKIYHIIKIIHRMLKTRWIS